MSNIVITYPATRIMNKIDDSPKSEGLNPTRIMRVFASQAERAISDQLDLRVAVRVVAGAPSVAVRGAAGGQSAEICEILANLLTSAQRWLR